MLFRPLGNLQASLLGLGTGRLASGGLTRANAARLLDTARDAGINLIDTADSYASGECERWLGDFLRRRREDFLLMTKAGYTFGDLPGPLRALNPFVKKTLHLAGRRQDFAPARLRSCLEASLQRLRTDRVDFFLLHTPPLAVLTEGAVPALLAELRREGKLRHFGVSSHDPAVLDAAVQMGAEALQGPVNPRSVAMQRDRGIGLVANQVFLSGKLLAGAAGLVEELARRHATSVRAVLLSFALSQPGVTSVLTGTSSPEHLRQNVADALAPVPLSAADLVELSTPPGP